MSNLSSLAFLEAVDAYHARFVFSDEAYNNITSRSASFTARKSSRDSCLHPLQETERITSNLDYASHQLVSNALAPVVHTPVDVNSTLHCSDSQVSSSVLPVTAPRKLVRDLAPGETLRLGYGKPSGLHFVRIPDQSARDRVERACDKCRFRKTKCSGDKPVCLGCAGKRLECVYSPRVRRTSRRPSQQTEERDPALPQTDLQLPSPPHPFAFECELFYSRPLAQQQPNLVTTIDTPPVLMFGSEATVSTPASFPAPIVDANEDVNMSCDPVDVIDASFDWSTVFTGLEEMEIVKDSINRFCPETQSHWREIESAFAELEWVHTARLPSLTMDLSIFQEMSDVFATPPNLDSPISALSGSLPATPSPQAENFPSFVDGGSPAMSPSMMFDFDYNGDDGILLYPSHFKGIQYSGSQDMNCRQ